MILLRIGIKLNNFDKNFIKKYKSYQIIKELQKIKFYQKKKLWSTKYNKNNIFKPHKKFLMILTLIKYL